MGGENELEDTYALSSMNTLEGEILFITKVRELGISPLHTFQLELCMKFKDNFSSFDIYRVQC